jgi:hypothetical protein
VDPLVRRLLVKARAILADGGDTNPCDFGAYCVRCCLGLAQTDLTDELGDGPDFLESLLTAAIDPLVLLTPRDYRLLHAVRYCAEAGDDGVKHTRASALSLIDVVLTTTPKGA